MPGHLAGALEELPGGQRGRNEVPPHDRHVVLRKRGAGFEIRAENVE
jgi:hypothetical protein